MLLLLVMDTTLQLCYDRLPSCLYLCSKELCSIIYKGYVDPYCIYVTSLLVMHASHPCISLYAIVNLCMYTAALLSLSGEVAAPTALHGMMTAWLSVALTVIYYSKVIA